MSERQWPHWMRTATLAEYLDISTETVTNWVDKGVLPPPRKRGGLLMWLRPEVDAKMIARATANAALMQTPKGSAMRRSTPWQPLTEDSFAALVAAYMRSPQFQAYKPGTQKLWSRELNFAARPDILGAILLHVIRPALIQGYLDGLEGRPGKQSTTRSALVRLERWAVVRDLLPRQIMTGVTAKRPQGGHIPWSDAEVELAERVARPDIARAITLVANTGQRGSDLIRMGPTDVETINGISGINVVQQ